MNTGDILILLVTIIALIWTIYNNAREVSMLRKQMELTFYTDYTKRYQEIILNFPENINECDFDFKKLDRIIYNKTMRYMRAYFDLCSEEYDLAKKGLIGQETWKDWEEGIAFALKKPAFKQAWLKVESDTVYYKDFGKWVRDNLS
ncbi:hypothetical protein [Rubrolithibacter danxiaensis]|uniref:hypothetical protein n=1 Tax=Rubrolithibacter danxiaensis TaxID=3390805 RepID=UPI003BF8225D